MDFRKDNPLVHVNTPSTNPTVTIPMNPMVKNVPLTPTKTTSVSSVPDGSVPPRTPLAGKGNTVPISPTSAGKRISVMNHRDTTDSRTTTTSADNDPIQWHALPSIDDALRILATDAHQGLSTGSANERIKIVGKNELTPPPKPSFWKRLWAQINNILVIILIAAAIVSGILKEWAEVGLIFGVLIINIAIGLIQEGNAEKAAEALKAMLSSKAMVIRNNGEKSLIEASELVPGDIVFVQSGDRIPADVRFVSTNNLSVQEAMLTGESLPVNKNANLKIALNAPLGDRKNMGFSATLVLNGTGTGVVVETGDWAEIGKINRMVAGVDAGSMKTRLMVQLEIFGRFISIVVFIIGISALLIAHLGRNVAIGASFQVAVAIAVAIIPEGLPAVVTITLAIGVTAMANHKAIIRQLTAVETLGSLNIICSDKTGTLTKNEMTAVNIVTRNKMYDITGAGYAPENGTIRYSKDNTDTGASATELSSLDTANLRTLLLAAALCNDSSLLRETNDSNENIRKNTKNKSNSKWKVSGDPTELALLCAAIKSGLPENLCTLLTAGLAKSAANNPDTIPRIGVIPFESEYKFMSTVHPMDGKKDNGHRATVIFTKGAPDRLIPRCMTQLKPNMSLVGGTDTINGNSLRPFMVNETTFASTNTESIDVDYWNNAAASLGGKGLRVLAVVGGILPDDINPNHLSPTLILNCNNGKKSSNVNDNSVHHPLALTMLGLVAIMDPPRDEVKASIDEAHTAGIIVKMITGDHPQTAIAIGKMLNIITEKDILKSSGVLYHHSAADSSLVTIPSSFSSSSSSSPVPLAVTGPQIDEMSDETLQSIVLDCNIFARASPENKIRIVKAIQAHGLACSMTGDGVNDAPALKAADVGVAMGITGTDVSKEAAKMVLADDNFSSIVAAVKQGRRVWDNLRKILLYNIPVNFAQGFATFFAYIIGIPEAPLTPIQILYVNMITSVTMGIAIAFEPPEADVMRQPPRPANKRIFGKQALWRCCFVAGLMVAGILGQFQWNLELGTSITMARAEAFTTLVMCEIGYAFNTRFLRNSSISLRVFQGNKWFFVGIFTTALLQVILVHVPYVNDFFSNEPLDGVGWGRCIGLGFALFLIVEIEKYLAPRYIMPCVSPFIHCLRRTVGKSSGGLLSIKSHDPANTRFIATSASTFGFSTGAGIERNPTNKPLEPLAHGGIRTESISVLLARERTRSNSLNSLTNDDIIESLRSRHATKMDGMEKERTVQVVVAVGEQ